MAEVSEMKSPLDTLRSCDQDVEVVSSQTSDAAHDPTSLSAPGILILFVPISHSRVLEMKIYLCKKLNDHFWTKLALIN